MDGHWAQFIEKCRQDKAGCEEAIRSLRAGESRLMIGIPGSMEDLRDVSEAHVAHLEQVVKDLDRLISEHEADPDNA